MGSVDLSGLIRGLLTVIGIALATGQYGKLESWARHQAIEAMTWKHGLPYFFTPKRSKSVPAPKIPKGLTQIIYGCITIE